MRNLSIILIASMSVAIASLSVPVVFAGDESGVSIENLMTDEELEATGVADLSGRELKALNAWLQRYLQGETKVPSVPAPATSSVQSKPAASDTTAAPPPDDSFGQKSKRPEIYSRIAGEFKGWTGKTRFPLENGQIWEQRKGWRWNITLDSPEVRIYKNFTGAYEMEIISEGRSIGVRRIK